VLRRFPRVGRYTPRQRSTKDDLIYSLDY
jgi:hypothetical protein